MTKYQLIQSTARTEDEAKKIARELLKANLCACVNIYSVQALYRWQGKIEEGFEWVLKIKTTAENYPTIEAKIKELNSYELPEVIVVDISNGSAKYLQWIDSEVLGENL